MARKVRDIDRMPNGKIQACLIGCRIEEETNEKLEEICFRGGVTKSTVIRRLVRQYVEENIGEERQQEAQRRQQIQETWIQYEEWRRGMIQQLDSVSQMARLALAQLEAPEHFTAAQCEAIQWKTWAEDTADILSTGTMAEQMEIFRDRKRVKERCNRILGNAPE